jgi:hypothetical protein
MQNIKKLHHRNGGGKKLKHTKKLKFADRHDECLGVVCPQGLGETVHRQGAALLLHPLLQASCPTPHSVANWQKIRPLNSKWREKKFESPDKFA